jgi:hypothetical protein
MCVVLCLYSDNLICPGCDVVGTKDNMKCLKLR